VSRERPGNVLSETNDAGHRNERGIPAQRDVIHGDRTDADAEAEAFIRFCYRRRAVQWPELYDEMCAVAARGDYRGLEYEELSQLGIGFALSSLPRLAELAARVIAQERSPQPIRAVA
jgi:hypothetical protein